MADQNPQNPKVERQSSGKLQGKSQVRIVNKTDAAMHLPSTHAQRQLEKTQKMPGQEGQQVTQGWNPAVPEHGKTLLPGGNNVDAEDWDLLKKHHVVAQYVELGMLQEGSADDVGKPEGPEAPASLGDRKPEAAKLLVDAESDKATLQKWYQSEQRDDVKQHIQRKLEAVGQKK